MKLWQETRGELTDDVDKTVSVCGLRHRTILVRQPFRSSRLITQHFGAGIMIMRPCEALLTTGRDFDQCHADREYASWRAAAYAETLSSRRLRVECLRASIRSIPKIALLTRYDRVLFPRRRRDGDLYALAVSLQREVPVAAPSMHSAGTLPTR